MPLCTTRIPGETLLDWLCNIKYWNISCPGTTKMLWRTWCLSSWMSLSRSISPTPNPLSLRYPSFSQCYFKLFSNSKVKTKNFNLLKILKSLRKYKWPLSTSVKLSVLDSFAVSVFVVDVELTNTVFVNSISTTNTETAMLSTPFQPIRLTNLDLP